MRVILVVVIPVDPLETQEEIRAAAIAQVVIVRARVAIVQVPLQILTRTLKFIPVKHVSEVLEIALSEQIKSKKSPPKSRTVKKQKAKRSPRTKRDSR